MAEECEVYIESSVRGYHAYFKDTTVCVGEVLRCEIEDNNEHDKYAIAVRNEEGKLVGHVPIELSKRFNKLLQDYGDIEAECIGNRFNAGHGKGLEFPADYRLTGNSLYLRRFIRRLKTKEFGDTLNISDIRKCNSARIDVQEYRML